MIEVEKLLDGCIYTLIAFLVVVFLLMAVFL